MFHYIAQIQWEKTPHLIVIYWFAQLIPSFKFISKNVLHIQKIPVNFFSIQDIHKILNKITERLNLDKNYHNTFPGSWVRSWCCNIYLYFGRIYRQRRQQRVSSRFTTGPASILCKNLCFFAIFIYLRVSLKDG